MKIVTIVGARPQFIKAAMISRGVREFNLRITNHESRITEVLIHTGQHYDYEMDKVFFEQLDIPMPDYHLGIGSGTHGDQTGRMLAEIEKVLLKENPDAVLVYGDTNSTLAGALAAAKLKIPVGHVEGGMRSFNKNMPEEINRVVAGHVAKWHFCPTETAVENLRNEGISESVYLVGDVMYDAVMHYIKMAEANSTALERFGLHKSGERTTNHACPPEFQWWEPRITKYALATVHRAENTDNPDRLRNIIEALVGISKDMSVIFPLHPRTKNAIEINGLNSLLTTHHSLLTVKPLPYIDVLRLEKSASVIITDSGGMQKEASWLGVPCITLRDETEWVETVEAGFNRVVGADRNRIVLSAHSFMKDFDNKVGISAVRPNAAKNIMDIIISELN